MLCYVQTRYCSCVCWINHIQVYVILCGCQLVCVIIFCFFILAIVLFVFRLKASDYPSGVFKHFVVFTKTYVKQVRMEWLCDGCWTSNISFIIGSLQSKDKQYNGQNKETKNDLQNTTQKTKDRVTRTLLKIGCQLKCSGRVSSCTSMSTVNVITGCEPP
jgi:hypothetical protein